MMCRYNAMLESKSGPSFIFFFFYLPPENYWERLGTNLSLKLD